MNVKRLFIMLVLPFIAVCASAQGKLVTGKVTDSKDGSPLAAVTVTVKGTKVGTATASDGTFKINVPEGSTTLIISSVGFTTQEVSIGVGQVNVSLVAGAGNLNEVVAIGYGSAKKKDLTGSVVSITSKDFVKGPLVTPEQLISGKVAGVNITSNGGQPGSGSRIRIRGTSSLSASNDPLIVIDGVPVANSSIAGAGNPLSFLNPNDIESFTVLKDASATAIYGSRASNGVIIVTTKKGKTGKLKATFSTLASVSKKTGQVDVLSPQEFRNLITAEGSPEQASLLGPANTNWQSVIYRTAYTTDNNLSLTGGIKFLPYRLSIGYMGQSGILKTDFLKRTSGSLNINPRFLNNTLKIDLTIKGAINKSRFANQGAIGSAVFFDPTQPVYGGKFNGYYETLDPATGNPQILAPRNPLGLMEEQNNSSNAKRSIGNITVDYSFPFLKGLRANLNVGYDVSKGTGSVITDSGSAAAFPNIGTISKYDQNKRNKLLESYLNYAKEFQKHRVDFTAGYGYQDFISDNGQSPSFIIKNLRGDSINAAPAPFKTQNTLVSFYGRLIYSFNDKYILTATAREDGSSRFAPDVRWGFFPSAALAWRISKETFLKNSKVLSDLKLRVGYGETGQQDIGPDYGYLPKYTISTTTAQYQFGDEFYNTLRPAGYDVNLKWEQTTTYNGGIDFGLFNGRISGSVDYYFKKTKDLLNFVSVPAGSNLTNALITNVGSMENRGVEATLNVTPVETRNFSWSFSVNGAYNVSKITKLTLTDDPTFVGNEVGGIAGGVGNNIQINSVGYQPNSFYVYKQVYDTNGKPVEGLYEDLDGNGTINTNDKYRYKNPEPRFFFGFSNNLSYKDWSLGFVARANLGNYVYNNFNSYSGTFNTFSNSAGFLNNGSANYLQTGFKNSQYFSDYYVENASFFRMDNISLGYNLGEVEDGVNIRLSAFVNNVFIITNYSGLDPEIAGGIDKNLYPRPRTFSLAVNIDF